jgi:hypothetical protein
MVNAKPIPRIKKVSAAIGVMRRMKPFVPMHTLESVYKSLVQPYFDYCSPLWDTCGTLLRDKLQKFQSRAARVVLGANYESRSADILNSLSWDTLENRRSGAKSVLMYKILNDHTAPALRGSFVKEKWIKLITISAILQQTLHFPKPKREFLKRSFKYSGALQWNQLPNEAKLASSLHSFRLNVG